MCLIIANFGKGKDVSIEHFSNAMEGNPDGIGIAYAAKGKVNVKKFVTKEQQKNAFKYYQQVRAMRPTPNIVIHFRYATHGFISSENTHPFKVNNGLYFAHNGIISNVETPKKEYSDTWHFNETILKKLPVNFLENDAIFSLIDSFIGYSKLTFIDKLGNIEIIGENLGHWFGGNWYSNKNYQSCSTVVYSPNTKKYNQPIKDAVNDTVKKWESAFNSDTDREIFGLSQRKANQANLYDTDWDNYGI